MEHYFSIVTTIFIIVLPEYFAPIIVHTQRKIYNIEYIMKENKILIVIQTIGHIYIPNIQININIIVYFFNVHCYFNNKHKLCTIQYIAFL